MTIIAAINDPVQGTWIGADTLVATESGQRMGYVDKWHVGNGWAIGFAGANSALTAMRDYLDDVQADWTPAKLWTWAGSLLRDYGFTPENKPGENTYWPISFLFATPEAVWSIGGYGDAFKAQPHQLLTRGSGSDFADGAGYVAARLSQPHQVILEEALVTAIALDGCCGGEVFTHLLAKEAHIEQSIEFQNQPTLKPAVAA